MMICTHPREQLVNLTIKWLWCARCGSTKKETNNWMPPGKSELKGKTVIGTCGDCEYWFKEDIPVQDWGNCGSKAVAEETHYEGSDRHRKHGCRHWKLKEK